MKRQPPAWCEPGFTYSVGVDPGAPGGDLSATVQVVLPKNAKKPEGRR